MVGSARWVSAVVPFMVRVLAGWERAGRREGSLVQAAPQKRLRDGLPRASVASAARA